MNDTPARLLHSEDGHRLIDQTIAANETAPAGTPATFDAWCGRCRARMPHRTLTFGRFATWQCQQCGYPVEDHEQKRAA